MSTETITAAEFAAAVRAINSRIEATVSVPEYIRGADGRYVDNTARAQVVQLRLTHSATGNGASRTVTDLTSDPAAVAKSITDEVATAAKSTRGAIRRERSAT